MDKRCSILIGGLLGAREYQFGGSSFGPFHLVVKDLTKYNFDLIVTKASGGVFLSKV